MIRCCLPLVLLTTTFAAALPAELAYVRRATWQETMLALRARAMEQADRRGAITGMDRARDGLERDFPVECDWWIQDLAAIGRPCSPRATDPDRYPGRWLIAVEPNLEKALVERALEESGASAGALRKELSRLESTGAAPHRAWLDLYVRACHQRRKTRLARLQADCPRFVFTRHHNMGGSHYAYTENQTDGHTEWNFRPGSALCLWEADGGGRVRTLIDDPGGVIRDPDVSYDGRRVLFAWKKSRDEDDYHLYQLDLGLPDAPSFAPERLRQLTTGTGIADYEGAYLPNGDIFFNSTRCVQSVDCWITEVSNFYACDRDGRRLRRLGFDQVHTNYPTVTEDGRVLYTRWEYNDRGQIYPQALFQMQSDGTGQTEFYGNNSWFPTTILHARNIPGTQKVLAIATGHHSRQTGKLIIIDPARGRQENAGVTLVAPVRPTPAARVDSYGQEGELFQYPYPLSETEYLVTYSPWGWARPNPLFGIYYMTIDGRRELLASSPSVSCNQPVPLRARPKPPVRPSQVDYATKTGSYYVQDVYAGPGLAGVPRGTVKKLRVVALDFRAAVVGGNGNGGVAGGAFVSTPVALGNGCWDPKIVLGEADVQADGSASFEVPARTPVYFQAIDKNGEMVQTMRSWSTLQPGETGSCVGCHESKNSAPLAYRASLALQARPQPLRPFYGPPRGFSFPKEIQPILDRHCIRCHDDRSRLFRNGEVLPPDARLADKRRPDHAFSLLGTETIDEAAKRRWSDAYLVLANARREKREAFYGRSGELVDWISVQSAPPMLPPYSGGSAKSRLPKMLAEGHKQVRLSREERDKIACWIDLLIPYCGDYLEANAWTPEELDHYNRFLAKRRAQEALERDGLEELTSR